MPVAAVARIIGEHDTRPWHIIHHYVGKGRARMDASEVTRVGIDETAATSSHNYITPFVDTDKGQVRLVIEGREEILRSSAAV